MFKPNILIVLQIIACLLTIVVMAMQIKAIYESRNQASAAVN